MELKFKIIALGKTMAQRTPTTGSESAVTVGIQFSAQEFVANNQGGLTIVVSPQVGEQLRIDQEFVFALK